MSGGTSAEDIELSWVCWINRVSHFVHLLTETHKKHHHSECHACHSTVHRFNRSNWTSTSPKKSNTPPIHQQGTRIPRVLWRCLVVRDGESVTRVLWDFVSSDNLFMDSTCKFYMILYILWLYHIIFILYMLVVLLYHIHIYYMIHISRDGNFCLNFNIQKQPLDWRLPVIQASRPGEFLKHLVILESCMKKMGVTYWLLNMSSLCWIMGYRSL